MKTQLTFMIAIISALLITACGGAGNIGTAQTVPADLSGYSVNDLPGTNAALAQKLGPAGVILESGYMIDGARSGQWTTYETDGKIKNVVNYIAGMKNGVELTFNNRGMITAITSYKNDQYDGLSGTYRNGRPEQEVSYKNGMYDGPTKKYFKNGKIQQEMNFKNNKQHGSLKYYDEEGNITMEYEYKNGEKVSGGIVKK